MGETRTVLSRAVSTNDDIATAMGGIDKLLDQLGFNLRDSRNSMWLAQAMTGGQLVGLAKLDGLAAALRALPDLPQHQDQADLDYVAEQRALRIVLIGSGRPLPNFTGPEPIALSADENIRLNRLKAAWLEGFSSGLARGSQPSRSRYTRH